MNPNTRDSIFIDDRYDILYKTIKLLYQVQVKQKDASLEEIANIGALFLDFKSVLDRSIDMLSNDVGKPDSEYKFDLEEDNTIQNICELIGMLVFNADEQTANIMDKRSEQLQLMIEGIIQEETKKIEESKKFLDKVINIRNQTTDESE